MLTVIIFVAAIIIAPIVMACIFHTMLHISLEMRKQERKER